MALADTSSESPYYTRVQEGRDALDHDVMLAMQAGYDATTEIAEYLGCTKPQSRTSLNRLIEDGVATWDGRGPSTRYRLTAKGKRRADKSGGDYFCGYQPEE